MIALNMDSYFCHFHVIRGSWEKLENYFRYLLVFWVIGFLVLNGVFSCINSIKAYHCSRLVKCKILSIINYVCYFMLLWMFLYKLKIVNVMSCFLDTIHEQRHFLQHNMRPIKKAVEEFCLWDVMLYSPLKVRQLFTVMYCLCLQGWKDGGDIPP
jgi:hypothetical protein